MKRLYQGFILILAAMILGTPIARGDTDNVSKAQVTVDPRCDNYSAIHDVLSAAIDPGDGVSIDVFWTSPGFVRWTGTNLVIFYGYDDEISVYASSDWPGQKDAEAMLAETEGTFDVIERAVHFMSIVHAWQAGHKR